MIQRLAVGLLCLASATLGDVNTEGSHSHNLHEVFDIKLSQNSPHSHLDLSSLSLVANSVGANATAPWAAGSVCTDEGEWNCLTTCWQRCASGVWSDTMALAEGTVCAPVGLSYDMTVSSEHSSGSESVSESERSDKTSASEDLSTIMAATTGPCQCTAGGCSSAPPPTPSSSSSTTTTSTTTSAHESSTGEFISGSSSAAKKQPASTVTVVAGVGMLAVVFARLLM